MKSREGLLDDFLTWAAQVCGMQAVPKLLKPQAPQQVAHFHDIKCLAPPRQVAHLHNSKCLTPPWQVGRKGLLSPCLLLAGQFKCSSS